MDNSNQIDDIDRILNSLDDNNFVSLSGKKLLMSVADLGTCSEIVKTQTNELYNKFNNLFTNFNEDLTLDDLSLEELKKVLLNAKTSQENLQTLHVKLLDFLIKENNNG